MYTICLILCIFIIIIIVIIIKTSYIYFFFFLGKSQEINGGQMKRHFPNPNGVNFDKGGLLNEILSKSPGSKVKSNCSQ